MSRAVSFLLALATGLASIAASGAREGALGTASPNPGALVLKVHDLPRGFHVTADTTLGSMSGYWTTFERSGSSAASTDVVWVSSIVDDYASPKDAKRELAFQVSSCKLHGHQLSLVTAIGQQDLVCAYTDYSHAVEYYSVAWRRQNLYAGVSTGGPLGLLFQNQGLLLVGSLAKLQDGRMANALGMNSG